MTSLKFKLKKLAILPTFYFHDALEQLKSNFHTNFRFKRVFGFVIEYAWISKLLRDAAFTWRPRGLSCRLKNDLFQEILPSGATLKTSNKQCNSFKVHLDNPPNFAKRFFPTSPGYYSRLKGKQKQSYARFLRRGGGGGTRGEGFVGTAIIKQKILGDWTLWLVIIYIYWKCS